MATNLAAVVARDKAAVVSKVILQAARDRHDLLELLRKCRPLIDRRRAGAYALLAKLEGLD